MIDTTILLIILLAIVTGFSVVIHLLKVRRYWDEHEPQISPPEKKGTSGRPKPKESNNTYYKNMNRAYRAMYGSQDD